MEMIKGMHAFHGESKKNESEKKQNTFLNRNSNLNLSLHSFSVL